MTEDGVRATMRDVAALAGVSTKTVSNVVTGAANVRPGTRERVEAAMARLDFVPNLSARGLRSGRSGVIALALPALDTPYSSELLHAIVEAAHRRGLSVQIEETATEPKRERDLLARARAQLVDGLVLNPVRLEDSVVAQADRLPPIVMIGEVEAPGADHVRVDSVGAAAEATRHVIAQGARRVAVLGGDLENPRATATSRLRLRGVTEALSDAGLPFDPARAIDPEQWTLEASERAVRALLDRGAAFDALVAFTDTLAMGALRALSAHGVDVPRDVLLTGFDDVQLSRFTTPSLTTIAFDLVDFSEAVMDLLVSRMGDRDAPPRSITLPHRLVVRESTRAVPRGSAPA
ncbi:LacI family DNA-binding transcriptional regulator [Microbacterium sp. gxy059]|uniref:LacI family DNA-binding transcriptional regulator n=1 Tax=Microbacterium sp. gxy059 TaxID=2957199 RepID=UPI003D982510